MLAPKLDPIAAETDACPASAKRLDGDLRESFGKKSLGS